MIMIGIARESGDIILINNDLRQLILTRIIGTKTISKIISDLFSGRTSAWISSIPRILATIP